MPELPEVETTVRQLRGKILGRIFVDVWSDWPKIIKKPQKLGQFKKEIKSRKIKKIQRRAKNILFELSGGKTLLIHQKMTGHLLAGEWNKKNKKWQPPAGPLSERINSYIHLLFVFDNGQMLALSDLRKFAKVELWDTGELKKSKEMRGLGPDPLENNFTFDKFKNRLAGQKRRIKQALIDPGVISGIGNIYSDEILWQAKVHPLKKAPDLSGGELRRIYKAIKKVLPLAIKLQGESISDYRVPSGARGGYDEARKAYRREGEECFRCGDKLKRVKVGGRSAHFCPRCQALNWKKRKSLLIF